MFYNVSHQEYYDNGYKKRFAKYKKQISYLENENNFLKNIINTLQKTVHKFIEWICIKFSIADENSFLRKFEIENDIYFDPEKN